MNFTFRYLKIIISSFFDNEDVNEPITLISFSKRFNNRCSWAYMLQVSCLVFGLLKAISHKPAWTYSSDYAKAK